VGEIKNKEEKPANKEEKIKLLQQKKSNRAFASMGFEHVG